MLRVHLLWLQEGWPREEQRGGKREPPPFCFQKGQKSHQPENEPVQREGLKNHLLNGNKEVTFTRRKASSSSIVKMNL